MAAEVGAELTMMENRFVPTRFKDGYGPVGAWFLLFKAKATNAFGEDYVTKNADMLTEFAPYDKAMVVPSCLRNHAMLKEMKEGRGPILMDTPAAMKKLGETLTPKEVKHLEAEAWEDFLDMCIGQAGVWAGLNIRPEQQDVRTHADRALSARLALRLLRHLGVGPRRHRVRRNGSGATTA